MPKSLFSASMAPSAVYSRWEDLYLDRSINWLAGSMICVSFSKGCKEGCERASVIANGLSKSTVSRLRFECSRSAETTIPSLKTPLIERKECVAPMKLATVFGASSQM